MQQITVVQKNLFADKKSWEGTIFHLHSGSYGIISVEMEAFFGKASESFRFE